MAQLALLASVTTLYGQIPDRLSLVRIPASSFDLNTSANVTPSLDLEFVDVYRRGEGGFVDYRWPAAVRIPAAQVVDTQAAGNDDVVLALASACNATEICSSAHPWPCCRDTDEQMLVLRRSLDSGQTFGHIVFPWLQPKPGSGGAWPFPNNLKAGGQLLWDSKRERVWLFFSASHAHDGAGHGCVGDGQSPLGLLLSFSLDLGLTFSAPFNLSRAITAEFNSSCVAPSGSNAAIDLGSGNLLFVADVVGHVPGDPKAHGELLIHASGGLTPDVMEFKASTNLFRTCKDPATGSPCTFDEAAVALTAVGTSRSSHERTHLFIVMRSDPAVTHQYATAHSTDGGATFGTVRFAPNLTSVACQPSAVAVPHDGPAGRRRLYVAAPQLAEPSPPADPSGRHGMTVLMSDDEGQTFAKNQSLLIYNGPSMYSNLVDAGQGDVLLFFERAAT